MTYDGMNLYRVAFVYGKQVNPHEISARRVELWLVAPNSDAARTLIHRTYLNVSHFESMNQYTAPRIVELISETHYKP